MTTTEQLTEIFNDNFVAYFRSHIAHLNIVGRNFQSDHALLNGIYDDLQAQIDVIGELIRSCDEFAPKSLEEVMSGSMILPIEMSGDADEMLTEVLGDLTALKGCYQTLIEVAEEEDYDEIANYAQDRVLVLSKFIWMLRATLD